MSAQEHFAAARQVLTSLAPGGDAVPPLDDQTLALVALTHAVLAVAAEMGVPEFQVIQPQPGAVGPGQQ